jgi:glutamine synthetase
MNTCDNHSIYKSGAKMIADKHEKAITFMAKYNEREGNSCHIHISFRDLAGNAVFANSSDPRGMSKMFKHFLAGQLKAMREFTLLFAPNIVTSTKGMLPEASLQPQWLGA